MRIHITGNAGAGKTTLALLIGHRKNLPVYHLDQIVWQPGWKKTEPEKRALLEEELISKPSWVIDGVSHDVRRAADMTIFLDVPRGICMARCFRRNLPYLFKSRPELPDNCPEFLIVPQLLKIIWRFPNLVKPIILQEMDEDPGILRIQNTSSAAALLNKVLSHDKNFNQH